MYSKLRSFIVEKSNDYITYRSDLAGQYKVTFDNNISMGRYLGELVTIKCCSSGTAITLVWDGKIWQQT
jgi:hypothetical protein